jgi:uncharacterized protein
MTAETLAPARRHRGPAARVLLGVVALYQAVRWGRPSPCRYYPSCSVYATEAIERHGAWRGGRLAVRRLSRCHPFGGHGIDLVPEAPMAKGQPS